MKSVRQLSLKVLTAMAVCLLPFAAYAEEDADFEMPNLVKTWTTSDGAFTVEAKAVRLSDKKITLMRLDTNQSVQVEIEKLSDEDREWIDENREVIGKSEKEIKAMTTKIGKALKGKTKGLVGEVWKKKEPKKSAKLYIAYFSASWCPPCRAGAPHSVSVYNEEVTKIPGLEVVMCSWDNEEEAAKEWALKEKMPWPVILKDDIIPEFKKIGPSGIPNMKLVDGEGNVILESRSMEELVKKAKETLKSK